MTTQMSAAPATPTVRWGGLLAFGAAVSVVAVVGGLAAGSAGATYDDLSKPIFAPPGWLFGPVWTVLYAMIAVAGWLVWRQVGLDRSMALYGVQLVLNACWTPLFFAAGQYELALVDIVVLLGAVLVTIGLFGTRSRTAALLLVPYAAWVAYATALTIGIVVLK